MHPVVCGGSVNMTNKWQRLYIYLEGCKHSFAVIYPSHWQVQLLLESVHHSFPFLHHIPAELLVAVMSCPSVLTDTE